MPSAQLAGSGQTKLWKWRHYKKGRLRAPPLCRSLGAGPCQTGRHAHHRRAPEAMAVWTLTTSSTWLPPPSMHSSAPHGQTHWAGQRAGSPNAIPSVERQSLSRSHDRKYIGFQITFIRTGAKSNDRVRTSVAHVAGSPAINIGSLLIFIATSRWRWMLSQNIFILPDPHRDA